MAGCLLLSVPRWMRHSAVLRGPHATVASKSAVAGSKCVCSRRRCSGVAWAVGVWHPYDATVAVILSRVMKGHIVTSEAQTNFRFGLFCLMDDSKLSVRWWILVAKRSLWRTPMFLENKSTKNMNPPEGGAYPKPTTRRLCRGGGRENRCQDSTYGVADGSL